MKCSLFIVSLVVLVPRVVYAQSAEKRIAALETLVAGLEGTMSTQAKRIAVLEDKLAHFSRDGNDVFISAANLHIVNGEGRTDSANGLGNLIVGYGELRGLQRDDRSGSHNVVVGPYHNYSRFGGLVAGFRNEISGPYSSITGGADNTALGENSSITGGVQGFAEGRYSSVSGGRNGRALGESSSVSGGAANEASEFAASVSGGVVNVASARYASVCGGSDNSATGAGSSVVGGAENRALGAFSSLGGGHRRAVSDDYSWAAGELFQPN